MGLGAFVKSFFHFGPAKLVPTRVQTAEQTDAQKKLAVWGANDVAQSIVLGLIQQVETGHLPRLKESVAGARLLGMQPTDLMRTYEETMAESYTAAEAAIRRALESDKLRMERLGMASEFEDVVLMWTVTFRETLREKARRIVDAGFAG